MSHAESNATSRPLVCIIASGQSTRPAQDSSVVPNVADSYLQVIALEKRSSHTHTYIYTILKPSSVRTL